ncbi:MAG: ATP-binding protein [Thermoplasmata archaeon]
MPDTQDDVMERAYREIVSASKFHNSNGPGKAKVLVMSGLPMSGKSHLTNLITERMEGNVCVVRADEFRPVVAKHMGRSEPTYEKKEHALVFQIGEHLIAESLRMGWSAIADATNLTEEHRLWSVRPATETGRPVLVAFLETRLEIAMERNRKKNRDGSTATPAVYALLNYEKEPIEKCGTPYLVINSEIDVRPWADILSKWLSGDIEAVDGTVTPKRPSQEPEKQWQKYRQAAEEKARLRESEGPGN